MPGGSGAASSSSSGGGGGPGDEILLDNLLPALLQTAAVVLVGCLSARSSVLPAGANKVLGAYTTTFALPALILKVWPAPASLPTASPKGGCYRMTVARCTVDGGDQPRRRLGRAAARHARRKAHGPASRTRPHCQAEHCPSSHLLPPPSVVTTAALTPPRHQQVSLLTATVTLALTADRPPHTTRSWSLHPTAPCCHSMLPSASVPHDEQPCCRDQGVTHVAA